MIFRNRDKELKKKRKMKETDSFWDISAITPPTKRVIKHEKRAGEDTVIVEDRSYSSSVYVSKNNLVPEPIKIRNESAELIFEYAPENCLINKIAVYSWPSRYTFYERFEIDSHKFFETEHKEVQPVNYFSYMPSYMQMSPNQQAWYFYWRSCVRKKIYLPTASSYILLYVYEIINLPDLIAPEEGVGLLCEIWEQYRKDYTKLDCFMSEWVCDYCLINKLDVPYDKIKSFYDGVIGASKFKQFYLNSDRENVFADLLFEKKTTYDWRNSKYINDSNRDIFHTHMKVAFRYAVKRFAQFDGRFAASEEKLTKKKTARDSFSGALCVYNIKKKIEITYFDIENIGDIGFIVTDIVAYCENKVRSFLGIRPKKNVQNLTEQQKGIIDEYFDAYLPCVNYKKQYAKKEKAREHADEYKFIEEQKKPFEVSFERAKEIERESWRVTDKLVIDELEIDENEPEEMSAKKNNDTVSKKSVEGETLDVAKEALTCIAKRDMVGFCKLAEECYMMPETLAECVNELCFELFGDIGIEQYDTGEYRLISDYEQEVLQWLKL